MPLIRCFLALFALFYQCACQEYDFAAEIKRQCLVPDPVGLLDCVENKVTLPYLTSWVDCTNSLGENVRTSADIINYRCKSVWEGKAVIPEVFYIKDCVIEKTGLPAKNVSAEVLGAYKECESTPTTRNPQSSIKTAPLQQQVYTSAVEYMPVGQTSASKAQNSQPISNAQYNPTVAPPTMQYGQRIQTVNTATQYQPQVSNQYAPKPITSVQYGAQLQTSIPAGYSNVQMRWQPYSQQYFMIYPQAPIPSQQIYQAQQKFSPGYVPTSFFPQQATPMQVPIYNGQNLGFYQYSYQIHHPQMKLI